MCVHVANTNGEFILACDVRDDGALASRRNLGRLEGDDRRYQRPSELTEGPLWDPRPLTRIADTAQITAGTHLLGQHQRDDRTHVVAFARGV